MKFFNVIPIVLGLCGCTAGVSSSENFISASVRDQIALCGAGLNVSQRAEAELAAEIEEINRGISEFRATAEINRAVSASILKAVDLSDSANVEAFKRYTSCVERIIIAG